VKNTKKFKNLILEKEILKMPCTHDSLSAKIAEKVGFKAICVGGYGTSASMLGKPDIGLLTMTEIVDNVSRICDCVDIPVFADADTGYGNTTNVNRTVRALEKAGAAGLFIEDQTFPKRCGHMEGKDVCFRSEIVSKIKAALDSRIDPDFIIMGRTDAIATHGLDEAILRGCLMQQAGADMIFIEAPTSIEQMKKINTEITAPTFAVYLEGGKIPLLSARQFEDLGYNVLAYGASGLYASAFAIQKTFLEIMEKGETTNSILNMIQFSDFNELLDLSNIRKTESKF